MVVVHCNSSKNSTYWKTLFVPMLVGTRSLMVTSGLLEVGALSRQVRHEFELVTVDRM